MDIYEVAVAESSKKIRSIEEKRLTIAAAKLQFRSLVGNQAYLPDAPNLILHRISLKKPLMTSVLEKEAGRVFPRQVPDQRQLKLKSVEREALNKLLAWADSDIFLLNSAGNAQILMLAKPWFVKIEDMKECSH